MLILVGVTVTVSLNGGLFEKAREGAKGTTVARVKEQILADIAVKMVDKEGRNITEKELQEIVDPKYGNLNEDKTVLTLNTGEEVPLSEIWNDFERPQKNEYGYYEKCIYGNLYTNHPEYFNEDQLQQLAQYNQTEEFNIMVIQPSDGKTHNSEWKKNSTFEDYTIIGDSSNYAVFVFDGDKLLVALDDSGNGSSILYGFFPLTKEDNRVYWLSDAPLFFSDDGKTCYFFMEGS